LRILYFERKPIKSFSFSLESIFRLIQNNLCSQLDYCKKEAICFNAGILSIIANILDSFKVYNTSIIHVTGEIHYVCLGLPNSKLILTVHDCRMFHRKKGLYQWLIKLIYLKWPLLRARIITTVSEETKKELIKITGNRKADIRVISNPLNPLFTYHYKDFNQDKPTILSIGTAENKNLNRLIEAISTINCTLVIIGLLDNKSLSQLKKYKIDYINFFSLSENEILQLYKNCDILSFVSLYEGFGMPIIEAQAVGRAVITSNISSMPEVASDAACIVDPYSVDSIRRGFKKIISDEQYRNQLIEKGLINIKRFEIQTIANKYLEIYQELNAG